MPTKLWSAPRTDDYPDFRFLDSLLFLVLYSVCNLFIPLSVQVILLPSSRHILLLYSTCSTCDLQRTGRRSTCVDRMWTRCTSWLATVCSTPSRSTNRANKKTNKGATEPSSITISPIWWPLGLGVWATELEKVTYWDEMSNRQKSTA